MVGGGDGPEENGGEGDGEREALLGLLNSFADHGSNRYYWSSLKTKLGV